MTPEALEISKDGLAEDTRQQYHDNFARHWLGVGLHLQAQIMTALLEQGFTGLRISFEPYITLSSLASLQGSAGARLSDIAAELGISRQAANQGAKLIEAAGYALRQPDPEDARAKQLVLTRRGRALVKSGAEQAVALETSLAAQLTATEYQHARRTLFRLYQSLELLEIPQASLQQPPPLAGLLPRLGDVVRDQLMQRTIARGHPNLKLSFGQVLMAIGPRGGRIKQMASTQNVSKQAISAIAGELEALGYIERAADPGGSRQQLLHFSQRGQQLISDSVASVDAMYEEFSGIVGKTAMQKLCRSLRKLYNALQLEEDIFGNSQNVNLQQLAAELEQQLGRQRSHALARVLLQR